MHVAQDRENPLVSRIGIGSQVWWSRSDGQREERRGVRNHTNHWAGCVGNDTNGSNGDVRTRCRGVWGRSDACTSSPVWGSGSGHRVQSRAHEAVRPARARAGLVLDSNNHKVYSIAANKINVFEGSYVVSDEEMQWEMRRSAQAILIEQEEAARLLIQAGVFACID